MKRATLGDVRFAPWISDLQCLPLQMEHEDFVMEGHGKTPPPGEENKQWVTRLFKKGLTIVNGVKHSRLSVLGALVGCLVLTLLVPQISTYIYIYIYNSGWWLEKKKRGRMLICLKCKSIEICTAISTHESEIVVKGIIILEAWHWRSEFVHEVFIQLLFTEIMWNMKEPGPSFWCACGRLVLFEPYFFRMHFNKRSKITNKILFWGWTIKDAGTKSFRESSLIREENHWFLLGKDFFIWFQAKIQTGWTFSLGFCSDRKNRALS